MLLKVDRSAILDHEVDGSVVTMRLADGHMFELTGSARRIWPLLDGTRDRDAVLADLRARFGDVPAMAGELDAFLGELRSHGLLA